MVDRLNGRLKDKDNEVERLHKECNRYKEGLNRLQLKYSFYNSKYVCNNMSNIKSVVFFSHFNVIRANQDKEQLEKKVNSLKSSGSTRLKPKPPSSAPSSIKEQHTLEGYRKRNFELEEEVITKYYLFRLVN